MRWRPRPSARSFRWETSVVRPASRVRRNAGDDGTREPRARDGSTKKILHRPFVFRDAETRVGTPVGRTVARFPPRTGNDRHHRHRESHAPRGSDGVTKGLSLRSRGRSRDTMHAKVEYKRIESNRSSLGRARGGLTTTMARMFPSWTDGRTDATGPTRRARAVRSVVRKKGFGFLSPDSSIVSFSRHPRAHPSRSGRGEEMGADSDSFS